jgi:hypothetical protein
MGCMTSGRSRPSTHLGSLGFGVRVAGDLFDVFPFFVTGVRHDGNSWDPPDSAWSRRTAAGTEGEHPWRFI